jgi:hypothetical protein
MGCVFVCLFFYVPVAAVVLPSLLPIIYDGPVLFSICCLFLSLLLTTYTTNLFLFSLSLSSSYQLIKLLLYSSFCLMFSYVSFFLLFFSGVFLFLLHISFLSLSLSLSPSLFFFLLSRYPPLSTSFPSFSLLPFHLLLLVSVFVSSL